MITLDEYKQKVIKKVARVLAKKRDANRQWDRDRYISYILGLLNGYEMTKGVRIKKETKKRLLVDIMVDSGVMAEVLV